MHKSFRRLDVFRGFTFIENEMNYVICLKKICKAFLSLITLISMTCNQIDLLLL